MPGSSRCRGYPAHKGRSAEAINELAQRTRRVLCPGLRDADPFHGLEVFETLHTKRVQVDHQSVAIDTDVRNLPSNLEAFTRFEPDEERFLLCLSEQTYEGLEAGDPRSRFTFAHELGHLVMHRPELLVLRALPALDRLLARASVSHPIYRDTEWQADTFGSRILVPNGGLAILALEGNLDVNHISQRFGVSFGAARVRLNQFAGGKGGTT